MKYNRPLLLVVSLLLTVYSFSQKQTQGFTLQEAIDFALENNRSVKNAKRDIAAAKEQKWETTATGLPQLNASIEYQNFIKQPVSLLPASAFDPFSQIRQLDQYYDLSSLPVLDDIPAAPDGFIPVVFGTQQNVNAGATLSQLVFDGSYLVGLQSAKVFLEISENAKEKTDLEVRKAVINAYGNVLLAQESVTILKNNIKVLEKNLSETQKIYENGLGEEESVEQLQITLSSVKNNLNKTQRLAIVAEKLFNITIGKSINEKSILTQTLNEIAAEFTVLSLLEASENVENTIDYKIASNDKRSKELLLKLEKSKALPSISAFLTGGYLGNSDSFTFFNGDQQWFGQSLFGANINIPIFSSLGRSAATQRARINLEKAEDDLLETSEQLRLQIASAKNDYQFSIEQLETAKQNLNLAERIEQKNQIKYTEGIATSFELRQAQTQLYTTQQEYLQAMLEVITNKAELETVLNELPKN